MCRFKEEAMGIKTIKRNVCDFLFVLSIVLSLFNGFHTEWVGKVVYTFLANTTITAIYPLFLLSVIVLFDNLLSGNRKRYKPLLIFLIVYIVVKIAVNLHGLITFRYAEYLKIDELTGISSTLFNYLKKLNPSISDYTCWGIVFMTRTTFNSFVEFYSLWFIVYSVALYVMDDEKLYKHISIGLYISMGIVIFYEIFEIAYFMEKDWGKKFIETVNPIILPVDRSAQPYPDTVRNLFHEASYYAYWACIVIPFFLYGFLEKRKWLDLILAFFLMGCMFGGNSRTGIALVFIELVVIFGGFIFVKKRKAVKPLLIIAVFLIVALLIGIVFLSNRARNSQYDADSIWKKIVLFMKNTMGTLFDKTERSNPVRFALRDAEFKTWLESPILGVGAELKAFYMIENYPEYGITGESEVWFEEQYEIGSAPYHLPALNQFTSSLASGGILGFMVDSMPLIVMAIWLFVLCFKRQVLKKGEEDNSPYLYILSSVVVILAFGFSCNVFIAGLAFMTPGLALAYILKSRDYPAK